MKVQEYFDEFRDAITVVLKKEKQQAAQRRGENIPELGDIEVDEKELVTRMKQYQPMISVGLPLNMEGLIKRFPNVDVDGDPVVRFPSAKKVNRSDGTYSIQVKHLSENGYEPIQWPTVISVPEEAVKQPKRLKKPVDAEV